MQNMRKPAGMLILLVFLAVWIWAAASLSGVMASQPRWLQLLFYIAAGVLWILPLRPLFAWMNAADPPEED